MAASQAAHEGSIPFTRSLKRYRSAQHFRRVSADANICDAIAFTVRANKNFAAPSGLNALPNNDLFVGFADSVLRHPRRGTAGCRSSRRIFATVKEHSRAHFSLRLRTDEIKEPRTGSFQEPCGAIHVGFEVCQRSQISKRHDRKLQSGGNGLNRPFSVEFVRADADDTRDFIAGECRSELRIALAHFAENFSVDPLRVVDLRIRSKAHG